MYRVYKILFILVCVVISLTLFTGNNVTKAVNPQLAVFHSFGVSSAVLNNYDKINDLFIKFPCVVEMKQSAQNAIFCLANGTDYVKIQDGIKSVKDSDEIKFYSLNRPCISPKSAISSGKVGKETACAKVVIDIDGFSNGVNAYSSSSALEDRNVFYLYGGKFMQLLPQSNSVEEAMLYNDSIRKLKKNYGILDQIIDIKCSSINPVTPEKVRNCSFYEMCKNSKCKAIESGFQTSEGVDVKFYSLNKPCIAPRSHLFPRLVSNACGKVVFDINGFSSGINTDYKGDGYADRYTFYLFATPGGGASLYPVDGSPEKMLLKDR